MKRTLPAICCLALLCCGLTACGDKEESSNTTGDNNATVSDSENSATEFADENGSVNDGDNSDSDSYSSTDQNGSDKLIDDDNADLGDTEGGLLGGDSDGNSSGGGALGGANGSGNGGASGGMAGMDNTVTEMIEEGSNMLDNARDMLTGNND